MNMREYIKKLQSKPEYIRKQIMYGTLTVSMLVIGLIWVSGIGNRFSEEKIAKIKDDIKPFALFGQSVKDTYSNVTASVGNISSSLSNKETKTEKKVDDEKQIDLIPVEYQ
jgi:hypothetical protein